jgi:hypothetical protein
VGDVESGPFRLSFNPQLRIEFRGATVTSDAGLLLPRELDERLGLSAVIERHLTDPRTGRNAQFPLRDLLRQSIYSRLAGYEDTNDAERLAEDPTFRMLASRERRETSVALTSTLHWFETDVLAEERNYQGLAQVNADLVQHAAARSLSRRVVLDIDSSESPVHGTRRSGLSANPGIYSNQTGRRPRPHDGVWRIWPEHGGESHHAQVEADPNDITDTNPDHNFEIHPKMIGD